MKAIFLALFFGLVLAALKETMTYDPLRDDVMVHRNARVPAPGISVWDISSASEVIELPFGVGSLEHRIHEGYPGKERWGPAKDSSSPTATATAAAAALPPRPPPQVRSPQPGPRKWNRLEQG